MRFYNHAHRFYCGVDLHARTMYLCIVDPVLALASPTVEALATTPGQTPKLCLVQPALPPKRRHPCRNQEP
jgi:hypothetical protein